MPDDAYTKLLADLLTVARTSDCSCQTCMTLRSAWTLFGVDKAVEKPRPRSVCPDCWSSDAPRVRQLKVGAVAIATINPGRCALCGMPLGG